MSYEGFSQLLCKNGHYWEVDCNELTYLDSFEEYPRCPICGEQIVWENMVDLTNGSYDDEGNRIDGFIELETLREQIVICPECKKMHICSCSKYKIPEGKK